MNRCSEWQERAALFAGGDLPPAETSEVEAHLAGCPSCQAFASELRADLDLLRAGHSGAVAPEHYVRLRARIMQRVDAESRRWSWWKPVLAFAVVAALLFAFFWTKPALRPIAARRVPASAPRVPAPAHRFSDAPRFAARARPPHHRRAAITPLREFEKAAALYARAGTPLGEGRAWEKANRAPQALETLVSAPVGTPAPAPATAAEPLVVKLLTNDPNVVIYWITDTKGDY